MDKRKFWNEQAVRYQEVIEKGGEEFEYPQRVLKFMKQKGLLLENSNVADIGCGAGKYALEFAKMGCDVTCMDISDEMLRYTAKNLDTITAHYTVMECDWDIFDIEKAGLSNRFDLAFASMSPAIHDEATLAKLSAISCGACFITKFASMNERIMDAAMRALDMQYRARSFDEGNAETLAQISALGYAPEMRIEDCSWQDMRTSGEMLKRCIASLVAEGVAIDQCRQARIEDAIKDMCDADGMICDKVDAKAMWIWWSTK